MKLFCLAMILSVSVAAWAFAGADVQYKVFQDGDFSVEHPDWKDKKPGADEQIFKIAKGRCSVLIDVFDGPINLIFDQTLKALEEGGNLIQADSDKYILEYKVSLLFIKMYVKKKFVFANDRTYAVAFAALGKEYSKKAEVADRVLDSIRPARQSRSQLSAESAEGKIQQDEFRYGVYGIRLDGSGLERIYASRLPIRDPEVSPDGKKIVFYQFTKDTNGDGKIYDGDNASTEIAVVNADGTGFRFLTENTYWDIQPNWTSDGRGILFASNRDSSSGYDLDLFIMDINTGAIRNISNTQDLTEADADCQAGKVVSTRFDRDRRSQSVWIMNEDGTDRKRISFPKKSGKSKTGFRYGDFDPNLSHDGKQVTFLRLEDDDFEIDGRVVGNYDVYIMSSDGSDLKNISNTPFLEGVPAWSPDGERVSFTVVDENIHDRYRIYISDRDGNNRQKITRDAPIGFLARECNWFPNLPGEHPDLIFAGEWYR